MKAVLLGASGQLGVEVSDRASEFGYELVGSDVDTVDITDKDSIEKFFNKESPEVVFNCAAYTAVDDAESNEDLAYKVNRDGAANVAEAVASLGCRLIHLSTDYVFSGKGSSPIREDDPTDPQSVYGASKRAGEEAVEKVLDGKGVIVRTSSLHGRAGPNFVHTMEKLLKTHEELRVVDDQVMSPTWAGWLAKVLLDLGKKEESGIFHASGEGEISWYGFTSKIYEFIRKELNRDVSIVPVTTKEFPRPAARPSYSVLDGSKLSVVLGEPAISWEEGLKSHLQDIGYLTEE